MSILVTFFCILAVALSASVWGFVYAQAREYRNSKLHLRQESDKLTVTLKAITEEHNRIVFGVKALEEKMLVLEKRLILGKP